MTTKIALLVDSASDVPTEITANENIEVVPLIVTANGQEYLDRETIQPEEVYQMIAHNQIPKTASPTVGIVKKSIEKLTNRGYRQIIAVTISSGLSITNRVFKQAAEESDGIKMTVIDSKNIGIGSGLVAAYAEELINNQVAYNEIVTRVEESVIKSRVYFYIPTLKYLRIGGRIGKVAGLIGSALNIKPIISCNPQGIYYPIAKTRSEKKAIGKLLDLAVTHAQKSDHFRMGVAQGNDDSLMKQVTAELKNRFPEQKIYTGNVSPALGVHTGPGLIGIAVQID